MRRALPSLALGVVISASYASSGCSPGADPADGTAEIGTGTTDFEPLAERATLTIFAGPQGGFHFLVHARVWDLAPGDWTTPGLPENPQTVFAAYTEEGERVDALTPPYRLGYRPSEDGSFVLPSARLLILDPDDETLPERLFGAPVRIAVRVEDAAGAIATGERWVVAGEEAVRDDCGPDGGDACP